MTQPSKASRSKTRKSRATTPTTAPAATPSVTPGHVLVLRTCNADMTSHGGFVWPARGKVSAPDWSSNATCGAGLRGLLWGEGDGTLLNWDGGAKWLVVEVPVDSTVDLSGKVKFPRGVVVYCGDAHGATGYIQSRSTGRAIVCGTATAGYRGTATAGYRGTATAGDWGTATAGDWGTATAGDYGTATAGVYGTATAGVYGEIRIRWYDGSRYRTAIGYVGEAGISAGVAYVVVAEKLARKDGGE